MRRPIAALALTLMLPLAASAQEPEHPRGGHEGMQHEGMQHEGMQHHRAMMGGMGMAMMRAHPGPGMILRLEDSLELSETQVAELEGMRTEAHEAMQGHMEEARAARERAHEMMTGATPDLDAFREALREAAMHTVEAQTLMARVHMAAGDVLHEAQREKLRSILDGMNEMHGEGHGGDHGEGQGHGGMHPKGGGHSGHSSGGR